MRPASLKMKMEWMVKILKDKQTLAAMGLRMLAGKGKRRSQKMSSKCSQQMHITSISIAFYPPIPTPIVCIIFVVTVVLRIMYVDRALSLSLNNNIAHPITTDLYTLFSSFLLHISYRQAPSLPWCRPLYLHYLSTLQWSVRKVCHTLLIMRHTAQDVHNSF